jgi:hypothetical protein
MVTGIPEGTMRLVDNRIVCGESTFGQQPVLVCSINHKEQTAEQREFVLAMIELCNQTREALRRESSDDSDSSPAVAAG